MCFPGDAVVKNPPANAGDTRNMGSIPGLGRSPGVGNGNPLQYSCVRNPMDRGAWWVTVHGVAESDMTEHTHTHTHTHTTQHKHCVGQTVAVIRLLLFVMRQNCVPLKFI